MDTKQQHQQKMRDKVEDQQQSQIKEEGHQPPPSTASPPSASSSPAHEFSFTISLHQPPSTATTTLPDKAKSLPSIAVDLSPADEIFFHGHLLPLHLLSHLPVSPRSSTNSLDSFTLPREILEDLNTTNKTTPNNINNTSINNNGDAKERPKSKSFSLFGLSKWRKGYDVREKEEKEKSKKKLRFDVSHVLKRYMRMVRPMMFFRGRRRGENLNLRRQPYSFSGNLSPMGKQELRGRRGEYSAPASMRTSPTNSGLLVATGPVPTSDSTMEELQAAIQAAIAHCKNSIAMDDKIKC